ncbi:universal stress protein [Streptomyces catenulae]|uniref:Universal stress protein n=1 Tax=Streptomyces catenulae TaxID=66875 RepID=A0ABV2YW00_9ACTN|nr:universal stress protein [Streptomyces catenulae]
MENRQQDHGRIVVGVDGSEPSQEALRWALRQAELTGSTVTAVMAWEYPPLYGSVGWMDTPQDFRTSLEQSAGQELDEALAKAVRPGSGPPVEKFLGYGTAAGVLLEAARGADLLVVGSRGRGGFTGALLGSVSHHCTAHAPCPVVVVRETEPAAEEK